MAHSGSWFKLGLRSNVQENFIEVSLDGNYIVAGGAIDWYSAYYLRNSDFIRTNCYPKNSCYADKDNGLTSYLWNRGFFHVYRDQDY